MTNGRNRVTEEYVDEEGVKVYPVSGLDSFLSSCTVLFCTLPGTADTSGMVDKQMLGKLPETAVVINIGRGQVIVEEDLFEALKNKKLFGAGLDVWWNYPPRLIRVKFIVILTINSGVILKKH